MSRANNDGFVERLIDAMEEQRPSWSQAELSKHSGVPPGSINEYLRKGRRPAGRNLTELAAALGVRAEWLLTGEEPRYRDRTPANERRTTIRATLREIRATIDALEAELLGVNRARGESVLRDERQLGRSRQKRQPRRKRVQNK